MSLMEERNRLRTLRFIGGPAHNDRIRAYPTAEYYYPVPPTEEQFRAALVVNSPIEVDSRLRVAVYVLAGDYPDEWFYRFDRIREQ